MNELNPQNPNDSTPEYSPESTPTDPRLDGLLDEALAAGEVPAGLNDRIIAATADRLPGQSKHATSGSMLDTSGGAVIGRIGGGFAWRSIAAVLLFGLILGGVWVMNQESGQTGPDPIANYGGNDGDPTTALAIDTTTPQIDAALDQLAEAELDAEWIDDRIELLSMQVTWAQDVGEAGVWGDGALESLDTAIARETFDDVADEMEWYF